MESLDDIVTRLDDWFRIAESGSDPAFSRYVPVVYEREGRDWRTWVEPGFLHHFNGLMVRGDASVATVFLAAFPSDDVLRRFVDAAAPGDLLFLHHPIDLESGDPRGAWGRFFRPIPLALLRDIQSRRLSIYCCHAPLDYHETISTARSIAAAIGGEVTGAFFPYGPGHAGVIAGISPVALAELEGTLRRIFDVPYLDLAGARPASIHSVAIVAGAGDRVEQMAIAEAAGAEAYITGEIHSRIDTEYGRSKFAEVERFAADSSMALIGGSHAASEFVVMRNEMRAWFRERCAVETTLLPEQHWWR